MSIRSLVIAGVAVPLFSFVAGTSLAEEKTPTKVAAPGPASAQLPRFADVSVLMVDTRMCQCQTELAAVNAMLPKSISVKVVNNGPATVNVKLDVKFKKVNGAVQTVTKTIADLAKNRSTWEAIFINQPQLVDKSYGITATATVTTPGVTDGNAANNSYKNDTCQAYVE